MEKMFKIFINILAAMSVVALLAQSFSRDKEIKEDFSIGLTVSDIIIPQDAVSALVEKNKEICEEYGFIENSDNPFFVLDAKVDKYSKKMVSTSPPNHVIDITVKFFIQELKTDAIYIQTFLESKGTGSNETKAFVQAIDNIKIDKLQFNDFSKQGKTRMLHFYESQCEFIVSNAIKLHEQGESEQALGALNSVPKASEECYVKCRELAEKIEYDMKPKIDTSFIFE